LLYLDYDGVLHPDDVRTHNGVPYLSAPIPGASLFMWVPILEQVLDEHPTVRIVLSTSWVRVKSFSYARKRLSKVLQDKVVGATYHSNMHKYSGGWTGPYDRQQGKNTFAQKPRYKQVLEDVYRRQRKVGDFHWVCLDDDLGDVPDTDLRSHPNFVWTNFVTGLSDPKVVEELRRKLK
jgi:hypothetical protein